MLRQSRFAGSVPAHYGNKLSLIHSYFNIERRKIRKKYDGDFSDSYTGRQYKKEALMLNIKFALLHIVLFFVFVLIHLVMY